MATWRRLLAAGHLMATSALVLRDAVEQDPRAARHARVVYHSQEWAKSDIAVLLPLAHCSRADFWHGLASCVANVAAGAKEVGKTVSVHVAAGPECSTDFAVEPFPFPDDLEVKINTGGANSSGALLAGQLKQAKAAAVEYELVLVMGVDAGVEVQHRAQESLCGSVAQVVSVLRQFRRDEAMQLVAPLGTLMTQSTKASDVMPALRSSRLEGDETCERMFSRERFDRLEKYAPTRSRSVAVAGGMYWARHKALPRGVPVLSQGLEAALGFVSRDGRDAQRTVLEVWIPTMVKANQGVLVEIPPAPKPLAMYFPQYHPIPENDKFWGKDFTEWTLLRPYQGEQIRKPLPVESGGLGYYDLLDQDTRRKQGELARGHGVHGFVFYHYWFSSVEGHKVMYKVPELRLLDGEPDVPFMLSWANEGWSRHWDGKDATNSTLLEQDYGGRDEWVEHFDYLLQFFKHPKYIRVEGKPAFAIYRPGLMKDKLDPMLSVWHERAKEKGLPGLHIIATVGSFYRQPDELPWESTPTVNAAFHFLASYQCCWRDHREPPAPPDKQPSSTNANGDVIVQPVQYWGAFAGFDNRPRNQETPITPKIKLSPPDFGMAVGYSLEGMANHPERDISDNLYFLASWNEWNEQSVLEPDDTYQFGFLEALSSQLRKMPVRVFVSPW